MNNIKTLGFLEDISVKCVNVIFGGLGMKMIVCISNGRMVRFMILLGFSQMTDVAILNVVVPTKFLVSTSKVPRKDDKGMGRWTLVSPTRTFGASAMPLQA